MTKISVYNIDEYVTADDKWIGTDVNTYNKTKNFTPRKLSHYFNNNQVINTGVDLLYKYFTITPPEIRPTGTLSFETEIGQTVNFSAISTFLLSKTTLKGNDVVEFLNFLVGTKVLLYKAKNINLFGNYKIVSVEEYIPEPNFLVVNVEFIEGNGFIEEDEDYMISLIDISSGGGDSPITIENDSSLFSTGLTGTGDGSNATNSIFFGSSAGSGATNVIKSNFFGKQAGEGAINASESNFFGNQAGFQATNAGGSNFFGITSGYNATDASNSNFFGYAAGEAAVNANNSNFIGENAGTGATNASYSNFFGRSAGEGATDASYSNFFGATAGINATNASNSNLLGLNVGSSFTDNNIGSNNIIIGTNISLPDATVNSLNIGGVLFGIGTYSTLSGDPSIVPTLEGKIGIGVVDPTNTLHIYSETEDTSGLRLERLTSASPTTVGQAIGVDASGNVVTVTGGVTNLTTSQTSTNFTINSDTGTDALVPLGNGTLAGGTLNNYTTAEKNKLAAITGTNTGDQNLQQVTTLGATTTNPITVTVINDDAIIGNSNSGIGVFGNAPEGTGIQGNSINGDGVGGYSETSNAGIFLGLDKGISVTAGDIFVAELNQGLTSKGLVINSGVSSTGNFIELDKNGVDKLVVNQAGELTATKLIKQGGTSSQFLKADGSVDSTSYTTAQNLQQVTNIGASTTNPINVIVTGASIGITGGSPNGKGINGYSDTGMGVDGFSTTGIGVNGYSETGIAAQFETDGVANIANFKSLGSIVASVTNNGNINANGFVKSGGTSTEILSADGSVITAGTNITITGGQISSVGGAGGGGSSVNYYLNGGTSQGTFGGTTYYEFSKTAVIGTGADFSRSTNGYIASFITDMADPSLLLIPGGNWNLEFYFSSSSAGGSPSFYTELYKYDGTTFTSIASSSATPEGITNSTSIDAYFTSLAVPETILTVNDRLAIRVFVNASSKTITLHTQNGHLCEVITTFTAGLTALNGLQAQVQNFATGTTGTDFAINSSGSTHTFNLPSASATARGLVSIGTQTFAGDKTFTGAIGASNLSGTNTGDNATNTQYSGLATSKQDVITLTTTGTSGASTLVGATLNIPQYSGATNLGYTAAPTNGTVTSSTGSSATLPLADATNAGLLKPAKFTVLENTSGTNTGDQDLSSYAPLASPTFTGTVVLPSTTSIGNVSSTEIGYLDNVTSSIQTQLDNKIAKNIATTYTTNTITTVTAAEYAAFVTAGTISATTLYFITA